MKKSNMKHRLLILVLIFILFMTSSCKKGNVTEIPSNSGSLNIIPLATGNTWNYKWTITDTLGNVVLLDTASLKLLGPDTLSYAYGYYFLNEKSIYLLFLPFGLCNNNDGLYAATVYPPPDSSKALIYPTTPEDSLIYDRYIIKTISIKQTITVPAGVFTCIQYDFYVINPYRFCYTMWCVPGVGIIKIALPVNYSNYEYQLVSYKLF